MENDNPFAAMTETAEKLNRERTKPLAGSSLPPMPLYTVRRTVKALALSSYTPARTWLAACARWWRPEGHARSLSGFTAP